MCVSTSVSIRLRSPISFRLQRFNGTGQVYGLLLDFRFQSGPQPEFLLLESQTLLEQ
jgi:hypothetical protein